MNDESTYQFPPGGSRGIILGLTGAQLGILGVGLAGALGALTAAHAPFIGLGLLALSAGWAWVPVSGHPVHRWVRPAGLHLWRPRRLAPGPIARTARPVREPTRRVRLPDGRRMRFVACPENSGIGLADLGRQVSFTLRLVGPGLALADRGAKAAALHAWADVLETCARGRLAHLQLTERMIPEPGADQRQWLESISEQARPDALADYRAHLEALVPSAARHELYLTAALGPGANPAEGAGGEVESLCAVLGAAGFSTWVLDPTELAGLAGACLDPLGSCLAPAYQRQWDHVVVDASHHVVFEAAELPRIPVGPDWAWPLIDGDEPGGFRSLALHMELAPAEAGLRRAERAVLGLEGDAATRSRWGFRSGARQSGEARAALGREAELAAGLSDARFVLLAGVAGPTQASAEEAARSLVAAAARSHVSLRRLYGRQAEALTALAPLGALRLSGGWS